METFAALGWVVLGLEILGYLTWRSWRQATRPPVQPPPTPEQVANEQAFDELEAATPRPVRMRLRRRTTRGRRHYRI